MQSFQKIKLDNGLRIILAPQPSNLAATVLVLVEAGSKYETKEISGLSHFLEHMCFKGTKKRPRAIDITSELDTLGAVSNAFTSNEYTGYFVKVQSKHIDKALDVVSDIYLNPVFEPQEIDKERGVIIEEINMYEDLPRRKVHDIFMSLLYGDQPAGWDISGRKEIIQILKRDDFLKYRKENYLAKSTIVVVAGDFNEKEVLERVKEFFSGIETGVKSGKVKIKEEQSKPAFSVKFKESDQTHLVLGFRAFDTFDERRFALEVLADVMGGSMSSRLFQKIREEMGAAYYVRADADLYTDHGYLAASAGAAHGKLDDIIKAALTEFGRIREEEVGQAELKRVKDHIIGTMILNMETSDELAGFYGSQEVVKGEIMSFDEVVKKIQAVSAPEIKAVAQDIIRDEKLNLALIGPFKDKDFSSILRV